MFLRLILLILIVGGSLISTQASNYTDCTLKDLPKLIFQSATCRLSDDAKNTLGKIAQQMRDAGKSGADCKLIIVGNPGKSEESQEKVNCRIGVIQRYLLNTEGLAAQRVVIEAKGAANDEDLFEFKTQ